MKHYLIGSLNKIAQTPATTVRQQHTRTGARDTFQPVTTFNDRGSYDYAVDNTYITGTDNLNYCGPFASNFNTVAPGAGFAYMTHNQPTGVTADWNINYNRCFYGYTSGGITTLPNTFSTIPAVVGTSTVAPTTVSLAGIQLSFRVKFDNLASQPVLFTFANASAATSRGFFFSARSDGLFQHSGNGVFVTFTPSAGVNIALNTWYYIECWLTEGTQYVSYAVNGAIRVNNRAKDWNNVNLTTDQFSYGGAYWNTARNLQGYMTDFVISRARNGATPTLGLWSLTSFI